MLSVIIPTYNEEENIEKCLLSLQNQTIPRDKYEIIVVDGQSTDKTVVLAKKYADKIILQKSNGIGGARNDGVAVAKYDLIATTDADCIIPENWLDKITKAFEDKELIVVSGKVKLIDTSPAINLTYWLVEKAWYFLSITNLSHFLCGANTAFRKRQFMEVGGYSDIPVLDDYELSLRIKKKGKIKYIRPIFVYYSARRIKIQGISKLIDLWVFNWARLNMGLPVKKASYAKQNYGE
ncbi:MAG: glycosyltransferase family 2 protein [archaeon]|nr:glycosyltransferase family 2 protein [archaeon]